jgi:hypothetical protein
MVAPFAGAWIETPSLPFRSPGPGGSRPSRARGLKLVEVGDVVAVTEYVLFNTHSSYFFPFPAFFFAGASFGGSGFLSTSIPIASSALVCAIVKGIRIISSPASI